MFRGSGFVLRKKASLYDQYSELLNEVSSFNDIKKNGDDYSIEGIFSCPHSHNFIVNMLWSDNNLRPIVEKMCKYRSLEYKNGYKHTISLYLLGILVAKNIGYDKFDLPEWDNDIEKNFIHHWGAICLTHDIGYFVENNKKEYPINKYDNISKIVEKFDLQYILCDLKSPNIINNYYRYRINKFKCIDHGIVAALILYNSLMGKVKKIEKMQEQRTNIFSDKKLCGKDLEDDIYKYANTIAHHNMWFKNSCNLYYKKYDLQELCIKKDNSHKHSFSKDPMLFLLCLLDTIEILKRVKGDCLETLKSNEFEITIQDNIVMIMLTGKIATSFKEKANQEWLDFDIRDDTNKQRKYISFNI